MRKYIVAIEETVVDEFEVYAENKEQAMKIAESKYKCGDFALSPGELCAKQIAILSSNEATIEWVDF